MVGAGLEVGVSFGSSPLLRQLEGGMDRWKDRPTNPWEAVRAPRGGGCYRLAWQGLCRREPSRKDRIWGGLNVLGRKGWEDLRLQQCLVVMPSVVGNMEEKHRGVRVTRACA